jgi:thiol-disulfide isomerase/thioredoxin
MMKKHGWWIITLALIGAFVAFLVTQANRPGKYDTFAQCINDSGAKFYGAWWCPHCHDQKILFGRSAKLLPYVECQTKSRENLAVCNDADVKSFPTWDYADGTRVVGLETFEKLSEKTGCALPEITE